MHTNDTTTTAEVLQEKPVSRRGFDLMAAPNCESSILAAPPQVTIGDDGIECLTLMGGDEPRTPDDVKMVLSTTLLPGANLVFVRAGDMGIMMSFDDYRKHLPVPTDEEQRVRDLQSWVDSAVYGLMHFGVEHLGETAAALWHAGGEMLQDEGFERRLGHLLMLDALIASPDAVQASLRTLRDAYVAAHADLQLVEGHDHA